MMMLIKYCLLTVLTMVVRTPSRSVNKSKCLGVTSKINFFLLVIIRHKLNFRLSTPVFSASLSTNKIQIVDIIDQLSGLEMM